MSARVGSIIGQIINVLGNDLQAFSSDKWNLLAGIIEGAIEQATHELRLENQTLQDKLNTCECARAA